MTSKSLDRRQFLLAGSVAAVGGSAAVHDGELGAPQQTIRGEVPWQEGAADSPPETTGSEYIFFQPTEVAFIEAAVARLIPNDSVGPGAVEAGVPFFLDWRWPTTVPRQWTSDTVSRTFGR